MVKIEAIGVTKEGFCVPIENIISVNVHASVGVAVDILRIVFGVEENIRNLHKIRVIYDGKMMFEGYIDEQIFEKSERGMFLKIWARSEGSILLENQAMPQVYYKVTLSDVFKRHIKPYGFEEIISTKNPMLEKFVIKQGMSEWEALKLFCVKTLNIEPRIEGLKIEVGAKEGKRYFFSNSSLGGCVYTEVMVRHKRCGNISQVFLKGKNGEYKQFISNVKAINMGIEAKRYIFYPFMVQDDVKFRLHNFSEKIKMINNKALMVFITCPSVMNVNIGDIIFVKDKAVSVENFIVSDVLKQISCKGKVTKIQARSGNFI
jgi:hypothetical protein